MEGGVHSAAGVRSDTGGLGRTASGPSRRLRILGVPVDCVSMTGAVERAARFLESDTPHAILAVNPEKVMAARANADLLRSLEAAALVIPDGIGVVAAARLLHGAVLERVPGAELMPRLCALAAEKGRGIFLFGAAEDVNRRAAAVLTERYPGLEIAGRHHGYVDEAGTPDLLRAINASGAGILFVALGSPRQELWMARHAPALRVPVCQGIGGTLDVVAGKVRRAPALFRDNNLEWLYRLASDPRRLKRQSALPRFAALVIRAKLGANGAARPSDEDRPQ